MAADSWCHLRAVGSPGQSGQRTLCLHFVDHSHVCPLVAGADKTILRRGQMIPVEEDTRKGQWPRDTRCLVGEDNQTCLTLPTFVYCAQKYEPREQVNSLNTKSHARPMIGHQNSPLTQIGHGIANHTMRMTDLSMHCFF
jgi:hypothetical protein